MITLNPFEDIKNTIIVLHDYASTANLTSQFFVPINEKVLLPEPTRLVFPAAPMTKMTYPSDAGTVSSWYDILADPTKVDSKNPQKTFSAANIKDQCKIIMDIVDMEINMFKDKDSSRVFLSGVGQGANMVNACYFAYKGAKPLGGLLSYLGMIPLPI